MIDRWDDQERFPLARLVDNLQRSLGALQLFTSATQGVDQAFHLGRALLEHPDRYLSQEPG